MMDSGTIITQGSFTSDGASKFIEVPQGADWLEIINLTAADGTTQNDGFKYYWQRGMGTSSVKWFHAAADDTMSSDVSALSIEEFDSSTYAGGSYVSVTSAGDLVQPTFATGSTTGVFDGAIVRLKGTDQINILGLDFSVDNVTLNTNFRLANALATAPGIVAGAAGFYKLVAPTKALYEMMIPAIRVLSDISQAASAVCTTLVDHDYVAGDKIAFKNVSSIFGMTEIDGLVGTVTAVSASTFTVNINSSAFTAFTFPTAAVAASAFTYASVTNVGVSTSSSYTANENAMRNINKKGFILAGGSTFPAGDTSDVIYWRAGKSFGL